MVMALIRAGAGLHPLQSTHQPTIRRKSARKAALRYAVPHRYLDQKGDITSSDASPPLEFGDAPKPTLYTIIAPMPVPRASKAGPSSTSWPEVDLVDIAEIFGLEVWPTAHNPAWPHKE